MNIRLRLFQIIFFALTLVAVGWGYKTYTRHLEILGFFKDTANLTWAHSYIDKKINFCDAPWQNTVVHKSESKEYYHSPKNRFKISIKTSAAHEGAFDLIDINNGKTLLTFTFNWDHKGVGLSHNDFKWAQNERFLLFRKPITMDNDWVTSRIYIGDTTTGDVIYLGDSEFYECVSRNW